MAILDTALKEFMGNEKYYNLLAQMSVPELMEFRYENEEGFEKKLTRAEMLERINKERINEQLEPYTMYWLNKRIKIERKKHF